MFGVSFLHYGEGESGRWRRKGRREVEVKGGKREK